MEEPPRSLLSLPRDLLDYTLSHFASPELLLGLSLVCRNLHDIASSEEVWRVVDAMLNPCSSRELYQDELASEYLASNFLVDKFGSLQATTTKFKYFLGLSRNVHYRKVRFPESRRIDHKYIVKAVLVGELGSGKTSLSRRYISDQYEEKLLALIRQQHSTAMAHKTDPSRHIRCDVWDTAAQQMFRPTPRNFVRFEFFQVALARSYKRLPYWYEQAQKQPDVPTIVVGNMSDIPESQRTVSAAFCRQHCLRLVNTSAKNDTRVDLAFALAATLASRVLFPES